MKSHQVFMGAPSNTLGQNRDPYARLSEECQGNLAIPGIVSIHHETTIGNTIFIHVMLKKSSYSKAIPIPLNNLPQGQLSTRFMFLT
ncbi:MAG: hypothetical protein SVY53_06375 [Chloroflexota bacterium]|nr:hypothetical protein [Chloroflexota bacterium]